MPWNLCLMQTEVVPGTLLRIWAMELRSKPLFHNEGILYCTEVILCQECMRLSHAYGPKHLSCVSTNLQYRSLLTYWLTSPLKLFITKEKTCRYCLWPSRSETKGDSLNSFGNLLQLWPLVLLGLCLWSHPWALSDTAFWYEQLMFKMWAEYQCPEHVSNQNLQQ